MHAEILTIGDELCRGETVDTNATWLADVLWSLGIPTRFITSCGDSEEDIVLALSAAVARSPLVVTSGGLGPTEDDLTVDVVSKMLGVEAVIDAPSQDHMTVRYLQLGRTLPLHPLAFRQVRVPQGASVFKNSAGLAPGFRFSLANSSVYCLPGVPREMKAIVSEGMQSEWLERKKKAGGAHVAKKILRVFGVGESQIAAMLEKCWEKYPGATLHYNVSFPETMVKLVVRDGDTLRAEQVLADFYQDVLARIGKNVYGEGATSLAQTVVSLLRERKLMLATAESCTGGLLGASLTDVAGASEIYLGGAVTYANSEKVRQLGVSSGVLDSDGAVSENCARQMADGIRKKTGADISVAITGIAGPGGGSEDKPVGTVWICTEGPLQKSATKKVFWPGSRDQVRVFAAFSALWMLRAALH